VLALRNCYHGMSEGTMGVTAHSTWKFPVPQASRTQLGLLKMLETPHKLCMLPAPGLYVCPCTQAY
jgi:4-aminobutyrate aminotransferase-like enzyme